MDVVLIYPSGPDVVLLMERDGCFPFYPSNEILQILLCMPFLDNM